MIAIGMALTMTAALLSAASIVLALVITLRNV